MMSDLQSSLRRETAFLYSPQPKRNLTPSWANANIAPAGGLYNFPIGSVGGAAFLQDYVRGAQSEHGIHWQIDNSSTGALHLTEFTVHGGAIGSRVTVEASFLLFPALAATSMGERRLLLTGLLNNGCLLFIQLELPSSADAILGGLSAERVCSLDLTQQLAPLGTPTSLAATPEAVVVGGSNGSVLCVPLSTLEDANTSRCFELRDSSWALTKLISGVLYRPRQPAALACVPVTLGQRPLLVVFHEDSSLRVFNVGRRQQVATLELEVHLTASSQTSYTQEGGGRQRSGGSRQLKLVYMTAESPQCAAAAVAAHHHGGGSEVTLVVEFEANDPYSRYVYAYTLSSAPNGRLLLSNRVALDTGSAVVSEARVSGDMIWLLVNVLTQAEVLGFCRKEGTKRSSALLGEAAAGRAAGGVGNDEEIDQELWEELLAAFPEHLSAETQVCGQLLVPGQSCRASLRAALVDHGANFSPFEVDTAPHAVLRRWIQTAVHSLQHRTPSLSASECWQSFLKCYRKHWARHHAPMGLVLNRGSPGWLGLARGGAMVCMLRPSTLAEVYLAEEASMLDSKDGLRNCVLEATALLGPLVQEACLRLLVAGVDPFEHLVPKLCEIWQRGPAATGTRVGVGSDSTSSGMLAIGTRAAALTDSAREAQQRWRQRRLQVIIKIGKLLGSRKLDTDINCLIDMMDESVTGMADQERTAAPASTMQGGSAGALAPTKLAATFLVATARQLSRAAANATRDVALLLGLMMNQGALGTVPVSRELMATLEGEMLPRACGLLRRAALGLWLTETSSSQDEAADMDPALSALRHLRLGSPRHGEASTGIGAAAAAAGASTLPLRQQLVFGGDGGGATAGTTTAAAITTTAKAGGAGAAGDISLAARLLPTWKCPVASSHSGRLDSLHEAGLWFTLYLQYGGIEEKEFKVPMSARVLQLGYQLFQAGEYANLAELAGLAGANGSSEAGPQFLSGLGITCALALERQGGAVAAAAGVGAAARRRSERIAEAAGCFFRAAASLASGSGEALRNILGDLRAELAGTFGQQHQLPHASPSAATADAAATTAATTAALGPQQQQQRREVALLQLHFCEAVMQLFEREHAPEGAVIFAEAALEHLRTAYGPAGGAASSGVSLAAAAATTAAAATATPSADPSVLCNEERTVREGRLWSNIYTYCIEMRQYERAYAALLANPLPDARLQSLRHLVHALAQEGQLQTLISLPFAGAAVVPVSVPKSSAARLSTAACLGNPKPDSAGQESPSEPATYRTVSLLSEALDMLHRRADNCDLSESPQPYKVLYDFLVCRGDFKGAARTMAVYAWRLRAEARNSEAAVVEALHAYDLAISCLSLLGPLEAYLDLTDPWVVKHAPHSRTHPDALRHFQFHPTRPEGGGAGAGGAATSLGAAAADDMLLSLATAAGAGAGSRDARRGGGAGGAAVGSTGGSCGLAGSAPVATVPSLQRERTLLFYNCLVAARITGLEPMRQWDNEDAILRQLLLMGRYEGALALVAGCYGSQGSDPWVKALETVVKALAEHCTRLQLHDGGLPSGGPPLMPTDFVMDDWEGGGAMEFTSSAAIAATLGGRAAPLWGKLRQLLYDVFKWENMDPSEGRLRVAWLLRDAVANAVLSTDPRVNLPQWLQDMFLAHPCEGVASAPASMGSWSCGPASLLSLYLRYSRLAAAVELVCSQVELWSYTDVLGRQRHCAAWIPYAQLDELHRRLLYEQQRDQQRFGPLVEQLNAAVMAHVDLVHTDTERVKADLAEGASGSRSSAGASGSGAAGDGAGVSNQLLMLVGPEAATAATSSDLPIFQMGLRSGLGMFGSFRTGESGRDVNMWMSAS